MAIVMKFMDLIKRGKVEIYFDTKTLAIVKAESIKD